MPTPNPELANLQPGTRDNAQHHSRHPQQPALAQLPLAALSLRPRPSPPPQALIAAAAPLSLPGRPLVVGGCALGTVRAAAARMQPSHAADRRRGDLLRDVPGD